VLLSSNDFSGFFGIFLSVTGAKVEPIYSRFAQIWREIPDCAKLWV
jgi:hypothetical protein